MLLNWIRHARSDQDLLSIHGVVGGIFDDLALPFFDARFVAALAACDYPVARARVLVEHLGIAADEVARSYVKIDPSWPVSLSAPTDQPLILTAIERLRDMNADPSRAGAWRPFAHTHDIQVKEQAGAILVRSRQLTTAKITSWLSGSWLAPEDAAIIERCWEEWHERSGQLRRA